MDRLSLNVYKVATFSKLYLINIWIIIQSFNLIWSDLSTIELSVTDESNLDVETFDLYNGMLHYVKVLNR